ncbi:molecular chaperone DnaJ [Echinicola strongylocentroti]|uniref:Molecular chaperone DnaJ n=1 Tax=Echinicola strongylocentroti TaxID=1795355 RepID=A0A2Z4IRL3_9BACT|nr:molecular chaperone DnaJ [Echinicola strongylocentroti]AWW33318.1 molecular chaperone DnaJ [Echinicola strongylocentroti]
MTNTSFGQSSPNLGRTDRLMEMAKTSIAKSDYEKANYYFRQIIESGVSIPPEMPYYFAETLYQLKQFDNSSNFLNKYLEINGFKAENYKEAKALQQALKAPLEAISSCKLCDAKGYRYQPCPTCHGKKVIEQDCSYCKGKGVVGCSRCKATGIVTRKNVFDITEYYQCSRCEGEGRLTCPRCDGTLKEVSACHTCSGFGEVHSEELCDHQNHDDHKEEVFTEQ